MFVKTDWSMWMFWVGHQIDAQYFRCTVALAEEIWIDDSVHDDDLTLSMKKCNPNKDIVTTKSTIHLNPRTGTKHLQPTGAFITTHMAPMALGKVQLKPHPQYVQLPTISTPRVCHEHSTTHINPHDNPRKEIPRNIILTIIIKPYTTQPLHPNWYQINPAFYFSYLHDIENTVQICSMHAFEYKYIHFNSIVHVWYNDV